MAAGTIGDGANIMISNPVKESPEHRTKRHVPHCNTVDAKQRQHDKDSAADAAECNRVRQKAKNAAECGRAR